LQERFQVGRYQPDQLHACSHARAGRGYSDLVAFEPWNAGEL